MDSLLHALLGKPLWEVNKPLCTSSIKSNCTSLPPPYIFDLFSRKVMLTFSFLLTGVPLFLVMAVPKDQFWVVIVLAYAGKTGGKLFKFSTWFTTELWHYK